MQGKLKFGVGGGQVVFVFRLPAGQVEFSGLFLTLPGLTQCQKELYGYVCTLAELSTNHRGPHGGGGV